MKQRAISESLADADSGLDAVVRAIAGCKEPSAIRAFLEDLCTPAELEAMVDRWKVVPLLLQGIPYRDIHDRTAVSVTTIGRVARTLEHGAGGYGIAARKLRLPATTA